jgi:hypothetical protein
VAAGTVDPAMLARLERLSAAAARAPRTSAVLADAHLHRAVAALAGNRPCRDALDRCWDRIVLAAAHDVPGARRVAADGHEHAPLIAAIAAGDADGAASLHAGTPGPARRPSRAAPSRPEAGDRRSNAIVQSGYASRAAHTNSIPGGLETDMRQTTLRRWTRRDHDPHRRGAAARAAGRDGPGAGDRGTAARADRRRRRRQIPGAVVRDRDGGSLEGTPGLAELAAGRTQVMMDPAFWTQIVGNLLVSRTVVLPKPIDLVKPEMYLPTVEVPAGGKVWQLPRRKVDLSGVTYEWQGARRRCATSSPRRRPTSSPSCTTARSSTTSTRTAGTRRPRHQPWSVTKSFISTVVGVMVDEGRVGSSSSRSTATSPSCAARRGRA